MTEFGVFTEFHCPPGMTEAAAFAMLDHLRIVTSRRLFAERVIPRLN